MKNTLFILSFLIFSISTQAQNGSLPRSTPEAEGVSADYIAQFFDAAARSKHEFHSIMIMRHGKVITEAWWSPYRADLKHTLYSCSKSFTATAVGFAVSEGKMTVNDKVISFFPNDLPDSISPNLAALRVRDLLSMSVGHDREPNEMGISDNWVKAFLKAPIKHQPGTKFLYNSPATYMLSAIVQKVTGQKVIDYLKPRLFDPLSISGMDWEISPQNINVGGWGLRLKTEDMAKFGQLFLQKGKWQGKQIIPESWIEEASTMKILQSPDMPQAKRDSSDWQQGYCYQMWRSRHNSYRGDGANGQFILVLPEHDAVIAITAETSDMQSELNLVWDYLLPAFKSEPLATKINKLALPLNSKTASNTEGGISGKNFEVKTADSKTDGYRFDFKNETCTMTLKTDSATYALNFGSGKWILSETTKFGPYLVARAKYNRVGLPPFQVAGSYVWKDEKTLELTLRYIESPHTETFRFNFEEGGLTLDIEHIFNKMQKRQLMKGILK
jgi:Beta-lactamase